MVATPPDEIQRQHEDACRRILKDDKTSSTGCQCRGEIPLSYKQQPVCHDPSAIGIGTEWNGCVSTRGHVDITALANLIREGYNKKQKANNNKKKKNSSTKPKFRRDNLWDPDNASANNVAVTRPSHDGWGIGKIVLVFCDDFLSKVYEMPWWHDRPDLRQAVQPILNVLEISDKQIVRLLLANLPPNTTIPVHHDSGVWVKRTHRVHVPVLVEDPTNVLFTCGPTADRMERIPCTPGHVFEMNNQAKHAVSNCCTKNHRVHLILDYVPHCIQNRIRLLPGERLVQTRRSMDRVAEHGKRPTPTYMILGAQKAGTTSLYNYMIQHPLVIPAKRRETHCLDWRWNYNSAGDVEKQRLHCLNFYHYPELQRHPSCLTGDSTPSYLLDAPRVIPNLKRTFEHYQEMKFLVMLRNPVQRAISHYAMVTSSKGTPQQLKTRGTEWRQLTFAQVVHQEMQQMQEYGLIPYWNIKTGRVNGELWKEFSKSPREQQAWTNYMTKTIPLHTGSHSLIARGLYALQLETWMSTMDKKQFLVIHLGEMSKDPVQTMTRVWSFLDIPQHDIPDLEPKNTRPYNPNDIVQDKDLLSYLERFYEPHNMRLQELLESL